MSGLEAMGATGFEILERVADGVIVVDADGRIVHATRRAGDIFGYDPSELVGATAEVLVPEASREVHARERSRYSQEPHLREMGKGLPLEGRRKDGTVVALDIRLEPLGGGLVVACVRRSGRDAPEVAELRNREQELHALVDTVTQHLFAVGMSLASLTTTVPDPAVVQRLAASSDLVERTLELTLGVRQGATDLRG